MWVRLTRRLANWIDGVNLAAHQVGDVLEVTAHDGGLLIAEEWAVLTPEPRRPLISPMTSSDLLRSDHPREGQEQRRAEDRFREELRDMGATTISKKAVNS